MELLEHRATMSAGKPASVLLGTMAENVALSPSSMVVCSVLGSMQALDSVNLNVWALFIQLQQAEINFKMIKFANVG